MSILKTVEQYKEVIQEYILTHPKAENKEIWEALISDYLSSSTTTPTLFSSSNSTAFSGKALIAIIKNQAEEEVLESINHYLKDHAIPKQDGFFALLIAYFYYFEELKPNREWQNYEALYQQIFIPLHLYREAEEKKQIESILAQINPHTGEDLLEFASQMLGEIEVPENLREKVVNQLLERMNDPQGNVRQAACEAAGQVKVPESLCEKVVNQLSEKINDAVGFVCQPACQALSEIKTPKSLWERIANQLLEKTMIVSGVFARLPVKP